MQTPNSLSAATLRHADAIVQKIAKESGMSDDAYAELRSHFEDKVFGYLRGDVRLSEADALLLAQAHFGTIEVVRHAFFQLHRSGHAASLFRLLAALVVATVLGSIISDWMMTAIASFQNMHYRQVLGSYTRDVSDGQGITAITISYFILPMVVMAVVTVGLLLKWRRGINSSKPSWFLRYSLPIVALITVLLFALSIASEIARRAWELPNELAAVGRLPWPVTATACVAVYGSLILSAAVWIWWLNYSKPTFITVRRGALLWISYKLIVPMVNDQLYSILGTARALSLPQEVDLRQIEFYFLFSVAGATLYFVIFRTRSRELTYPA